MPNIDQLFEQIRGVDDALDTPENRAMFEPHADRLQEISDAIELLATLDQSLINHRTLVLLAEHIEYVIELSWAMITLYREVSPALAYDEKMLNLLAQHAERSINLSEAIRSLYDVFPDLIKDQKILALLAQHIEKAPDIAQGIEMLYRASPELIDDDEILTLLIHANAKNIPRFSLAIGALHRASSSLLHEEKVRALLMQEGGVYASDVAQGMAALCAASLDLVHDEKIITLLGRHIKDVWGLGHGIAALYRASPNLIQDKNLVLLAAHAEYSGEVSDALISLYQARPDLVEDERNRALIANFAQNASAIGYTMELLYRISPGFLNENTYAALASVAAHADDIYGLADILDFVRAGGMVLTQEDFARCCQYADVFKAFDIDWGGIPPHLATRANFDIVMQICLHAPTPNDASIAIQDHFARLRAAQQQAQPVAPAAFNPAQSTHTASVHRSVSESAVELMRCYGASLQQSGLGPVFQHIQRYIDQLPPNSEKKAAAERALIRLQDPIHRFSDPTSGISTQQLLGLCWLATLDESRLLGCSQKEAQDRLVDCLYQAQREYNLDAHGADNQTAIDHAACASGTFNKLMESLWGVHASVNITYITKEGASSKLPRVVIEELVNLVKEQLSRVTDQLELEKCKKWIDALHSEGLDDETWGKLQPRVLERMFDEFGSLYPNKQVAEGAIAAGQYVNVEDIPSFAGYISKAEQRIGEAGPAPTNESTMRKP